MPQLSCRLVTLALACALTGCGAQAQPPNKDEPKANPDALVLQDFKDRIDGYMKLQNQLTKGSARLKETKDPAKIKAAEDELGEKIRTARTNARQGDIFTPDIAAKFRRLMYPELKGPEGRETKSVIKEESPESVKLQVNARYPIEGPLPTMPPNLLASLPTLPEDLEYRIVGKHLILRDVPANIIVDFIPNAIH
jgi:hypothetical protein